ncbi:MAG: hypothetical protein M1816_006523 [Peltula sp. TS41687]|nr:MAG: hypothetical protein M1816_006523 [Peltula sp. TS41687]
MHSVESAGIATAVLPLPSDRSYSTSAASTITNSINPTTEETFTGLGVERTAGNVPSPFSHSSESFPGHLPPPPLTAVPIHRRRRFSKSGMPAIIKRAASTPNVRGLATSDVTAMSYDKRRNKLGYHRTSVACGHCRRRKIRCLLAPDDPQGRCSNCIRLKKECNFFPVDQPPPSEASKGPALKESRNVRGQTSSSSPSPNNQQRAVKDHISNYHQYSPASIPSSTHQDFNTPPTDGGGRTASVPSMSRQPLLAAPTVRPVLPHMQTAPPLPGTVEFQAPERPAGWESSPYLDQSPMSNGHRPVLQDPSSNFWKLTESPITPAFSSFAGPPGVPAFHHRESVSAFPYAVQREDPGWPLQSRSMSFSHLEGLSINQSGHYPAAHDYKQTLQPHPYTPSYAPITSLPEPTSAPPDGRTAMAPSWNPSYTGNSIGGMPSRSSESFGGWYPEPGRLAQVAEEASTGPLNEDTPAYYHGTAQSTA